MAHGKKNKKDRDSDGKGTGPPEKLSRKEFEAELAKLQAELVQVQLWVQQEKRKILVLFEGRTERPLVFTPHLGEFRALAGDQLADAAANDRWAAATKAAQTLHGCVLLKGVPTVVADVRGPVHVVAAGNPGLATGGSGDVLSGFIGAFLARGVAAPEAAALGAHALGRAAELGARAWSARSLRPADVLASLPEVWRTWADRTPPGPPVLTVLEMPEAV